MDVVAWPMQRKFSCCRKVHKSCNEHRDPFKSASLALYTIYDDKNYDEYESVESENHASWIKIYYTFDRSAVKIHRKAFVSCSHVKACNFSGFVNISSETVPEKLSPLNELCNYGDR